MMTATGIGIMSASVPPAIKPDAALEKEVERIVRSMTLEQKIGQMCEVTIDVISPDTRNGEFRADKAKLDKLMKDYKVGSVLNVPNGEAQSVEV